MKEFFDDEFINKKLLCRMQKEIKRQQLEVTIDELNYLNELQSHIISRCDFTPSQNRELDFIKKVNNARRKNIQA